MSVSLNGHLNHFSRCPDCEHENYLCGCECENEGCMCFKKRTGTWTGKRTVNGGGLPRNWEPWDRVGRRRC